MLTSVRLIVTLQLTAIANGLLALAVCYDGAIADFPSWRSASDQRNQTSREHPNEHRTAIRTIVEKA
jgi:hypothetical protein